MSMEEIENDQDPNGDDGDCENKYRKERGECYTVTSVHSVI